MNEEELKKGMIKAVLEMRKKGWKVRLPERVEKELESKEVMYR